MFRNPFSKTYTVICPDGPRTVHRNVNDIFPLHLKYSKSATGASIRALHDLQAKMETKKEDKVAAVLVGIDRTNQSMQAQFRAAYAVFQASPCTELPYLKEAIARITIDEQKLRAVEIITTQLNLMITGRPKGNPLGADALGVIDGQLAKAIETLLPSNPRIMIGKMEEVAENTAKWSGP